jgi:hypothetical protein
MEWCLFEVTGLGEVASEYHAPLEGKEMAVVGPVGRQFVKRLVA